MGKGKNKGKTMAGDKKAEVKKEVSVSEEVEIKEDLKVTEGSEKPDEPMNTATDQAADPAPEEKTGGEKNEENKDEPDKKTEKAGKKKKPKKNKKKKLQAQGGKKPETSGGFKGELAGLIFMCNSKTKKDCFRYRVFGLPKSKKELVEKVTNGMRLFLYDFDLRLMYGVYKAAGRGGFDLEPDAFKTSDKPFPAQVRFRIQKECLPLSEDKFKAAIKDNYYGKNKFNFELNAEQVKNLSQLFRPVPQDSHAPRDNRPGKPAREGIKNGRMAREKRRAQVPLLHQRAPYVDAYALQASDPYASVYQRHALPPADPLPVRNALQASDPYASVYQRQGLLPADPLPVRNALQTSDPYASIYQRQALPPADPLPMRNGLVSDFDYRGVDPELEYLHRQRIRERMLEQTYLDEINRTYAPREADYGETALRRNDFTSASGLSYPSLIGSSSLYRY